LEEHLEHPPSHPIETDPQFLPKVLNFKEEKKGVYRQRKADAIAEDDESPYECPTVGM